jgi:hypothetical protein
MNLDPFGGTGLPERESQCLKENWKIRFAVIEHIPKHERNYNK